MNEVRPPGFAMWRVASTSSRLAAMSGRMTSSVRSTSGSGVGTGPREAAPAGAAINTASAKARPTAILVGRTVFVGAGI